MVVGDERAMVEQRAEAMGFEVVRSGGDVVVCHGGDGTLLRAERFLPGLPKVPARHQRPAHLCPRHGLEAILTRLAAGELERVELPMLALAVGRKVFHAMNDVVLRNDNPALAVRFRLLLDGQESSEFTGDGLVIATPFGSTAYYHSITGDRIHEGMGVAFNNCTTPSPPMLLDGRQPLTVLVSRGPGTLVHDNDLRPILLREGHRFTVHLAERRAIVLGLEALSCQECRRHDDQKFNPH
jgi:NAD+ kinase